MHRSIPVLFLLLTALLVGCGDDGDGGGDDMPTCQIVATLESGDSTFDYCRCDDGRLGECQEDACVCTGAHLGEAGDEPCALVSIERANGELEASTTPLKNPGWCAHHSLSSPCLDGEVAVGGPGGLCLPSCQTDTDCNLPENGALVICEDCEGQGCCKPKWCESADECPEQAPFCEYDPSESSGTLCATQVFPPR